MKKIILLSTTLFLALGGTQVGSRNANDEMFNIKKSMGLMMSIHSDSLKGVKKALKRKADVNYTIKGGNTPLHIAFIKSKEQLAELRKLIRQGMKPSIKNASKQSAMEVLNEAHNAIVGLLNKEFMAANNYSYSPKAAGNSPLHKAIAKLNQVEIVKALVESGANVKAKNNLGQTPMDLVNELHVNIKNILNGK